MSATSERQRPVRESDLSDNADSTYDGAPLYDVTPIMTSALVPKSFGIMALDLAGVVRVITERRFNRYIEEDGVLHGSHKHGFVDLSELYHVSREMLDGEEHWIIGERVSIAGLTKFVESMQHDIARLGPDNDIITDIKMHTVDHSTLSIDPDTDTIHLHAPPHALDNQEIITTASDNNATIEITKDGVALLLATKLGENVCLGPEDPTVVPLSDGTVRVFITLAVKDTTNRFEFKTLMLQGTSLHDLEAVGFVPVGMVKEMCFGPIYHTDDGDKRVMLGEGSFVGYSTVRTEIANADFALDSFTNTGAVSMMPANIHDRFAQYYAGTTTTPESQRYRWVGEHISPNKVIDHDILPLFDGWHVVMTSGRSHSDDGMGPFEVGIMVTQLDPSHKYAGQSMWIDDRPLFRLYGAESITFGSDWYIKPDGKTGMDRTIVFIVHRDDQDICPVEMKLSDVWDRLPEFLRENDEAAITAAADAVIRPHIDLPIEERQDE